jgi:hypothetical protein
MGLKLRLVHLPMLNHRSCEVGKCLRTSLLQLDGKTGTPGDCPQDLLQACHSSLVNDKGRYHSR